jgi:hypothetical protein
VAARPEVFSRNDVLKMESFDDFIAISGAQIWVYLEHHILVIIPFGGIVVY